MLSNDRRRTPLTFADSPYTALPVFEDYVHTVHPETGLDVVFCPGEAKPPWFLDAESSSAAAVVPPSPPDRPRGNKAVKTSRKTGDA